MKTSTPLSQAEEVANAFVLDAVRLGVRKIDVCGSIRRKEATVGDVDVVVEGELEPLRILGEVTEGGTERLTLIYRELQVNVFRSVPEEWGAALFYATGPAKYQIAYRSKAKFKGWLLNNHGLFDQTGGRLAGQTEEEIYAAFSKEWKAPERRGKKNE